MKKGYNLNRKRDASQEFDIETCRLQGGSKKFQPFEESPPFDAHSSTTDIDQTTPRRPNLCSEYCIDMYLHFKDLEAFHKLKNNYMDRHRPFLNPKARSLIVASMLEVHAYGKMAPEILYLAVSLLDRYLAATSLVDYANTVAREWSEQEQQTAMHHPQPATSGSNNSSARIAPNAEETIRSIASASTKGSGGSGKSVADVVNEEIKKEIKLITVATLMMAIKVETAVHCSVSDLISALHFRREVEAYEVINMEIELLCALRGYVSVPTLFTFLCRFVRAAYAKREVVQLASYVGDLTLMSYELLSVSPSLMAAACVYIARKTFYVQQERFDTNRSYISTTTSCGSPTAMQSTPSSVHNGGFWTPSEPPQQLPHHGPRVPKPKPSPSYRASFQKLDSFSNATSVNNPAGSINSYSSDSYYSNSEESSGGDDSDSDDNSEAGTSSDAFSHSESDHSADLGNFNDYIDSEEEGEGTNAAANARDSDDDSSTASIVEADGVGEPSSMAAAPYVHDEIPQVGSSPPISRSRSSSVSQTIHSALRHFRTSCSEFLNKNTPSSLAAALRTGSTRPSAPTAAVLPEIESSQVSSISMPMSLSSVAPAAAASQGDSGSPVARLSLAEEYSSASSGTNNSNLGVAATKAGNAASATATLHAQPPNEASDLITIPAVTVKLPITVETAGSCYPTSSSGGKSGVATFPATLSTGNANSGDNSVAFTPVPPLKSNREGASSVPPVASSANLPAIVGTHIIWTATLVHYTGYTEEEVHDCARRIQQHCFPETLGHPMREPSPVSSVGVTAPEKGSAVSAPPQPQYLRRRIPASTAVSLEEQYRLSIARRKYANDLYGNASTDYSMKF